MSIAARELIVVGILFAGIAYLGVALGRAACKNIVPFEDGPPPGDPPVVVLMLASALLGVAANRHGIVWAELAVTAFILPALIACWVSDVLCGILPDRFTLIPLAGLVGLRVGLHQWELLSAGALVFLPFALIAVCSKGVGMGWGDVKLATLGGVLTGAYAALSLFILASFLAVIVALMKGRKNEPIAFGPYLTGAIGFALAAGGPNV